MSAGIHVRLRLRLVGLGCAVVLGIGVSPALRGQESGGGAFLEFVRGRADSLRADDRSPATAAEWEERWVALRPRLEAALGGLPDDAGPLEPRVLGVLEREGYRVEKVVFTTMPGVRMTANAWVPDGEGPFPAVLCVHGHWSGAKQDPAVQARCIGLAKLGFFVLAVDAFGAGERGIGKALGEYHGAMTAATLIPTGRMLAGLQVRENRRAVDYLRSRPEVDPERIGVTGASGGGNQSMHAGALDERLGAVVPVCSVGNFRAYLGVACCLCEVVPGALAFTEEWGVLGLVAPRALLVVNATRDSVQFSVDEARKSIAGAAPVFELLGAGDRLRHDVFESPHDYNREMREAMYGWMTRHLKREGDGRPISEPAFEAEDPEDLRCFPGGSRPDDWLTLPRYAAAEGRRLVEAIPVPGSAVAWEAQRLGMRAALRHALGGNDAVEPEPGAASAVVRENADGSATLSIEPESGITVRARRVSAADPDAPIAVVLDCDGVAAAAGSGLASGLAARGWTVVSAGLRATGENAWESDRVRDAPDHNTAEWSLWIGRPLLGQWVRDVRAWLDALDVGERQIAVIGRGPAGLVALAAAALDDRIDGVATVGTLASFLSEVPYENQRLGTLVPGILRDVGDVDHLAALVAPRPLVLAGPVTGGGAPVADGQREAAFAFARQAVALAGGRLDLLDDPGDVERIAALLAPSEGNEAR